MTERKPCDECGQLVSEEDADDGVCLACDPACADCQARETEVGPLLPSGVCDECDEVFHGCDDD